MGSERSRSLRDRRRQEEEEEAKARKRYALWGGVGAGILILAIGVWAFKGFGTPPTGTTDPEAKTRLEKLFELYKAYSADNRRPPPNEQALKDYYAKLSTEQKARFGDNVETLFQNPRDGEKYEVRYGVPFNPGGSSQAIMWEKNGQGGKRYVALSMGYVVLRGEEDFNELVKRK
jgi:hypothetical protein